MVTSGARCILFFSLFSLHAMEQPAALQTLPKELQVEIIYRLDAQALVQFSQVNRTFCALVQEIKDSAYTILKNALSGGHYDPAKSIFALQFFIAQRLHAVDFSFLNGHKAILENTELAKALILVSEDAPAPEVESMRQKVKKYVQRIMQNPHRGRGTSQEYADCKRLCDFFAMRYVTGRNDTIRFCA